MDNLPRTNSIFKVAGVAVVYFVVARASLLLQFDTSNASPVWPPSGIALAVLIIFGKRVWPGIFIGAFAANVATFLSNQAAGLSTTILTSICIAAGNSIEAITGNYLLQNKNYILGISSRRGNPITDAGYFYKVNQVFWFLYSALIMCLLSAVAGVTSIYVAGIIPAEHYLTVAFTWWVGDVAGILVITPLLLSWFKPRPWKAVSVRAYRETKYAKAAEVWVLYASVILMSGIIFCRWFTDSFILSRAFFIIPFMVWAALRFRLRATTSVIGMIALMAIIGTMNFSGPFITETLNNSLITGAAFIAIISMTSLALQAVLQERRATERELRNVQNQLTDLVREGAGRIEDFEARIHNLQNVMMQYAKLDFEEKAPVSGRKDELDAIASGLNHMADEIQTLRAAEKFYVKNIRDTEARFRLLVDNVKDYSIFMLDEKGNIASWNKGAENMKGYTAREILGKNFSIFYTPEELANNEPSYNLKVAAEKGSQEAEGWRLRKDGSRFYAHISITAIYDTNGHIKGFAKITRDVTQRRLAEEKIKQSEELFSKIFRTTPTGIAINNIETGKFVDVNESFLKLLGYSREEVLGKDAIQINIIGKTQRDKNRDEVKQGGSIRNKELQLRKKSGERLDVLYSLELFEMGEEKFSISILHDITERKAAEALAEQKQAEVEKNRQFLLDSQQVGKIGSWERDLQDNTITGSPEYFKIVGIVPDRYGRTAFSTFLHRLHPDDRDRVKETIEKTVAKHSQYDIEYRIVKDDGSLHVIWAKGKAVHGSDGNAEVFRGTVLDITDRKEAENKQAELAEELTRSNKELEQFAYVASHDLQEPLRIVTSYVQLMERRFSKDIDSSTKEYMTFIVEAVGRMRSLIQDLLAFSRVGTQVKPFMPTDTNRALTIALDNLATAVHESDAEIISEKLPEIMADDTQIVRLFQNLIGNAIKFRSEKKPVIKISAKEEKNHYLFKIEDNGIGIAQEYRERIFVIFQRLNDRAKYPGTGIGLAICKKIVELHGGRIWVEAAKKGGSAFYFTIKK